MATPAAPNKTTQPTSIVKHHDTHGCASLLGYGMEVHFRSGGICQICKRFGVGDNIDFDLWRQLSVEHLVGRSADGHIEKIKEALRDRDFEPSLDPNQRKALADELDAMNTVSACSFCNSMTSRMKSGRTMTDIIQDATGGVAELRKAVKDATGAELSRKQAEAEGKLKSIREAFGEHVAGGLANARKIAFSGG